MFGSSPLAPLLLQRLPLPLAQLYGRAHNARTALELHQTAYYLWEAALKLLGAVAVVEYAEHGPADPRLEERLQSLSRPSLGHWWEFVRRLVPVLADAGDPGFRTIRDLVLGRTRDDLPRTAGLDAALTEALEGKTGARSTVRLSELFDRLVQYRNREVGHGAAGQRPTSFYERMGKALLAGVPELLGPLDVLAGRRLIQVAEVRARPDGSWLAERLALNGTTGRRLEPLTLSGPAAGVLPRPERLYLESEGGRLTSLHPLVIYEADAGEVLFFSARRGRQKAEYLCYTSGRALERADLTSDQRELLARVLGVAVAAGDMDHWQARSVAEQQAAESVGQEEPAAPLRQLGDFELLSKLGQGGMGVVYRAWQPSLGRQVALKCLLGPADDGRAEARFAREIRALGRVEHPHLVRIFTSGSEGDRWFYAMELVEGPTLAAVCERLHSRTANPTVIDWPTWAETVSTACQESRRAEKPLSDRPVPSSEPAASQPGALNSRDYLRHIVELVRQVAEAAHALHEAGIIHRDIKPGNIMLTPDGLKAVLTDLGLAQLSDEVAGKLTRTRQFVGTLRYASPEQVLAVGAVDRRSDVYSLGVTLWELLTLRPMYGATEQTPTPELMQRIQYAEPESPRRFNARVSRDLDAVVLKCLEKDPKLRYTTAAELAEDLQHILDREPVQARPVGWMKRSIRRMRRRPLRTSAVAGAIVLMLVALGALWYWDTHYRLKVEYFAQYTRRWGALEGVGPLSAAQVRHRAGSYRISRRGSRVEKVEYVNGHGRLRPIPLFTYIDDPARSEQRPECQLEFHRDANGQVVQEVARDASGAVVWMFQYTTAQLGHFTDRLGFPRARAGSGATYVRIEHDANGMETAIHYLGADGRQQPGQDGTFGHRIQRDGRGLPSEVVFLGPSDGPAVNREGLSRVTIRCDDQGNWLEVNRYGLDGQPIRDQSGCARYTCAYDDHGNRTLLECYGPDGQLTGNRYGFARSRVRLDDAGSAVEEAYEDDKGRPVRCKAGFARAVTTFDERGNPVEAAYFDEAGRATRNRDGVARQLFQHDDWDRVTEVRFADEEGRPTLHRLGYARLTAQYDARGQRVEEAYFDERDRPAWHPDGYVRWTARHDERGNQVEQTFFGADGRPTRCKEGYARWTADYDGGGNRVAMAFWDEDGQSTRHKDGHAAYTAHFDDRGNRIEMVFLDAAGRKVPVKNGYAQVKQKYDERGRLSEIAYFNSRGKPVRQHEGFARQTFQYDDRSNPTEVAYWDETGNPARKQTGESRSTAKYDERGSRIEEAYFDAEGKPMQVQAGYARWKGKYDERGNLVELSYFDERGQPMHSRLGYFRSTARYDAQDRQVEVAYWDEHGRPAAHAGDGACRLTRTFDERGNTTAEASFDRDNRLARNNSGYARYTARHDPHGNIVEMAYWDEQGQPAFGDHFVRFTARYDERDNRIEKTYWDKDGRPRRGLDNGYARVTAKYDPRGNLLEEAYWDEAGRPTPNADGQVRVTARYDDRDNRVEEVYFGPDGKRVKTGQGYARRTARYDGHDNKTEEAFFDDADWLVRGPSGWARARWEYDTHDNPLAVQFFDTDDTPMHPRVVVARVLPNGQAEQLGLRAGDALLTYDSQAITDVYRFINGRKAEKPTDPAHELQVRRGQETIAVNVRPGPLDVDLRITVLRDDGRGP